MSLLDRDVFCDTYFKVRRMYQDCTSIDCTIY